MENATGFFKARCQRTPHQPEPVAVDLDLQVKAVVTQQQRRGSARSALIADELLGSGEFGADAAAEFARQSPILDGVGYGILVAALGKGRGLVQKRPRARSHTIPTYLVE